VRFSICAICLISCFILVTRTPVLGQQSNLESGDHPKPVLYVVGTSHLDSQWNWTVQDTIREFVPNTFFENFKRFERYPNYKFNYEGAIHYMWFKEYHPEAWPTLKNYVASGRWQLSGSWINAVDTNIPSPESLMRQALYGKRFFRQEFGKTSHDVYLPDCFGFGFALPSIAAHCGLTGFTTQKLTWGSSYGIPFPIGRWKGVDGSTVIAALNPGDYVTKIRSDISLDPKWSDDLTSIGGRRKVAFRLFGTGDIGGAPDEESVSWLEKALSNNAGAVEVRNTSADQLSRDLTPEEKGALPEYEGELTMKTHGVGCYTSQAAMKRFNRENELLADAAERAGVAATLLTGAAYPTERLREAWIRFLWHQFHDDLTGTSIPQAYQFSWNDELVSANQFAAVLTSSVSVVAESLDTRTPAIPIVVYNPASARRQDVVDATVEFATKAPAHIRVVDGVSNREVPTQVLYVKGKQARILFIADVAPIGFKVFEVKPALEEQSTRSSLQVTDSSLENARYLIKLDRNGDIASVFDKEVQRELLKDPIRLELRNDPSPDKPAWRILWDTVNSKPREYVNSPAFRIVERGPVRATIEVTRHAAGSTFVQRVMLTEGGDRVDIENVIDWRSPNSLLKASFSFSAKNPKATYDLGLGTIQRGNNTPEHYEVPAQRWADLTDASDSFGVAILNDTKYGWDKPEDDILRLTLLHTAKARAYPYQSSNDLGHHRFVFSIAGHAGDWRTGQIPRRASALTQPLQAFQTEPHAGNMGRAFSLLSLANSEDQITVQALKKAEDSAEIVLRVQERYGRSGKTLIKLAAPIIAAREVNAGEEVMTDAGPFHVNGRSLALELKPYQPRTFALRLHNLSKHAQVEASPIALPFNADGISTNNDRSDGDFDRKHQTLAAEQMPTALLLNGIQFKFGPSAKSQLNLLIPKGEQLRLPKGTYNRMYLIAAAVDADQEATFAWQGHESKIVIREWQGPIGQWDSRLKTPRQLREVHVAPMTSGQTWAAVAIQSDLVVNYDSATGTVSGIDQVRPGFVKRDEVAYVGTHRHAPDGDQPYIPTYLFLYAIDLPPGLQQVQLPNNDKLRILAATVVHDRHHLWPVTALYAADL
jgi:alpha-mannosidase